MKIYLETKDKDNHRIVFVQERNNKLVYAGEWCARKQDVLKTVRKFVDAIKSEGYGMRASIEERPYKPGAFAKNSGPAKKKAVKSTTKKKK